ncbi:hypothetical protein ARMGADRAFT_1112480 [Armillaria gallica]|uniref:Uncharacterized protein n=1 Tax=Armillaria gallica TaxID=47427 RepID=A0A2H3D4M9_ARMGA|nr:hypothetical protein ARMGADRAFT_1112480 [Armillaria gallica]
MRKHWQHASLRRALGQCLRVKAWCILIRMFPDSFNAIDNLKRKDNGATEGSESCTVKGLLGHLLEQKLYLKRIYTEELASAAVTLSHMAVKADVAWSMLVVLPANVDIDQDHGKLDTGSDVKIWTRRRERWKQITASSSAVYINNIVRTASSLEIDGEARALDTAKTEMKAVNTGGVMRKEGEK